MKEKEKIWIKSRIKEYYENAEIEVRDIEKREFGIGNWGKKIERRHLSFNSNEELRGFLIQEAPLYVSYSSSLYEDPSATPMENKNRIGVELVFDLDGEDSSKESLSLIKKELVNLIRILKKDFGVKDFRINFSGNRGFHLHVHDKEFLYMSREARKRFIEYLKGNFDYDKMFFTDSSGILRGPKEGDKGFKGRFAEKLLEILKKEPERLGRKVNVDAWRKALKTGNYSLIPIRSNKKILEKLKIVGEHIKIKSIDVDAGVTYDISKLIRMPNSIHGSTGFIAKTINEGEIERFNPYNDALPLESEVKIKYLKTIKKIERDGENSKIILKRKGYVEKVNSSIAMFLLLKELATLY